MRNVERQTFGAEHTSISGVSGATSVPSALLNKLCSSEETSFPLPPVGSADPLQQTKSSSQKSRCQELFTNHQELFT